MLSKRPPSVPIHGTQANTRVGCFLSLLKHPLPHHISYLVALAIHPSKHALAFILATSLLRSLAPYCKNTAIPAQRTVPSPARRERARVRVTGVDKGEGYGKPSPTILHPYQNSARDGIAFPQSLANHRHPRTPQVIPANAETQERTGRGHGPAISDMDKLTKQPR